MDANRMITTRIWADSWFETLDPFGKLIWLYLLSNQQTNLIGIYEISARRISNETGIDLDHCETVLKRFQKDCKIVWNGSYMVVCNFLKHQKLANPNMKIAAERIFNELPESFKKLLQSHGINDFTELLKGFENGSETVGKPLGEREREIESEIERESETETENLDASVPEAPSVEVEVFMFAPNGISQPTPAGPKEEKEKVAPKRKRTQLDMMQEVTMPHDDPEFKLSWTEWLKYKTLLKDTYKAPETMQQALNKFAEYPPIVGIRAIKDSISNQWKGVFPENKKYHDAADKRTIRRSISQPIPGKGFGAL